MLPILRRGSRLTELCRAGGGFRCVGLGNVRRTLFGSIVLEHVHSLCVGVFVYRLFFSRRKHRWGAIGVDGRMTWLGWINRGDHRMTWLGCRSVDDRATCRCIADGLVALTSSL